MDPADASRLIRDLERHGPILGGGRTRSTQRNEEERDKKREREERESTNNKLTRTRLAYRGEDSTFAQTTATISFDGACRNNGTGFALASIGVFTHNYNSKYTAAWLLPSEGEDHVTSNNVAELLAAAAALQTAIDIAKMTSCTNFIITGDSMMVISATLDGRAYSYQADARHTNSKHWSKLATTLTSAANLGISCQWVWQPRHLNCEADELCNAALDGRGPNRSIRSNQVDAPAYNKMTEILDMLANSRRPTVRRIPRTLESSWVAACHSILQTSSIPRVQRALMLMLPHLLSIRMTRIANRTSFKIFRDHINLLQDRSYLHSVIHELHARLRQPYTPTPSSTPSSTNNDAARNASLVRQELYSRLLKVDDITVAPPTAENKAKVSELFPAGTLPPPLHEYAPAELSFGDVMLAIKKLKKGKTPGLTGWTRELLSGIIFACTPHHRMTIGNIFTTWACASDDVVAAEWQLIQRGILTPFLYTESGKLRPIVMTDTISKVLWYGVLTTVTDPNAAKSTHVFGKPGACQLAVCAVQAALDAGEVVIAMDAKNAFNTVNRATAYDYINKHRHSMGRAFRLINTYYSQPVVATWFDKGAAVHSINITTGTIQGCASSLWFYTMATMAVNLQFSSNIVQAADDVYIFRNALSIAPRIIQEFADGPHQDITGPKTRILCASAKRDSLNIPTCLQHAQLQTSPTRILGALVQPDRQLAQQEEQCAALNNIINKLERKYAALNTLTASKQVKWLTLLNITMHGCYYLEASSIGARRISTTLDQLQIDAFNNIFDVGGIDSELHVQLFIPIEDGGMGLFPYGQFTHHLYEKTLAAAKPFLDQLGLRQQRSPDYPVSPTMCLWRHSLRPDIFGTKDWKVQRIAKSWLRIPPHMHESFLRLAPTNIITSFTDEQFEFAIQHRLHRLPLIGPIQCASSTSTSSKFMTESRKELTAHLSNCTSCCTGQFFRRHEAVLHAFYKACKYHGYDAELINPGTSNHARPGHSKGGADMVVHSNGNSYIVDVTLTKEGSPAEGLKSRLTAAFNTKIRTYDAYAKANPKHIIFPFVMSVYGTYHETTVSLLTQLAKQLKTDTQFRQDVLRHTQCALQKSLAESFSMFKARQTTLLSSITSPTDLISSTQTTSLSSTSLSPSKATSHTLTE
jgi:ribonuclease HI